MHFIGDGMALHTFANDFFGLLGSTRSDAELEEMLELEWAERWQNKDNDVCSIVLNTIPDRTGKLMPLNSAIDSAERLGRQYPNQVE